MSESTLLSELLELGAIHINLVQPYQWASGWLSPIYCDNRRALSSHKAREIICEKLAGMVKKSYPEATAIAGVATGAIAIGVLVAHALSLPFSYVRPKPKDHGLGNQIEGYIAPGAKVVVVEDLISTGGSSLAAVEALRGAGVDVLGMVAIFTYGFPQAQANFEAHRVQLETIESYAWLIDFLKREGKINQEQESTLQRWRQSPETWGR